MGFSDRVWNEQQESSTTTTTDDKNRRYTQVSRSSVLGGGEGREVVQARGGKRSATGFFWSQSSYTEFFDSAPTHLRLQAPPGVEVLPATGRLCAFLHVCEAAFANGSFQVAFAKQYNRHCEGKRLNNSIVPASWGGTPWTTSDWHGTTRLHTPSGILGSFS